jgi:hypothetical protein
MAGPRGGKPHGREGAKQGDYKECGGTKVRSARYVPCLPTTLIGCTTLNSRMVPPKTDGVTFSGGSVHQSYRAQGRFFPQPLMESEPLPRYLQNYHPLRPDGTRRSYVILIPKTHNGEKANFRRVCLTAARRTTLDVELPYMVVKVLEHQRGPFYRSQRPE